MDTKILPSCESRFDPCSATNRKRELRRLNFQFAKGPYRGRLEVLSRGVRVSWTGRALACRVPQPVVPRDRSSFESGRCFKKGDGFSCFLDKWPNNSERKVVRPQRVIRNFSRPV